MPSSVTAHTHTHTHYVVMALLNKLAECASASGVVFKVLLSMLCVSYLLVYVGAIVCCTSAVCMLWLVWAAPLSVQVLTFRHLKLFKDVFFPFVLIVIQPLLGAVLLHSLCCNTLRHRWCLTAQTNQGLHVHVIAWSTFKVIAVFWCNALTMISPILTFS